MILGLKKISNTEYVKQEVFFFLSIDAKEKWVSSEELRDSNAIDVELAGIDGTR